MSVAAELRWNKPDVLLESHNNVIGLMKVSASTVAKVGISAVLIYGTSKLWHSS